MRVLVACEFSGRVRDAFIRKGHDAISCDLLPGEGEFASAHYQGNVLEILKQNWDLMIAHPPCTYLSFAGIRWNTGNEERQNQTLEAIGFFNELLNADIPRICIENPVGVIPRRTGIKWDQMIHPWQFGHGEQKKTCLWLKNLPHLNPTNIVPGREQRIFKMSPSADRGKKRSITFEGIANAMAEQWG